MSFSPRHFRDKLKKKRQTPEEVESELRAQGVDVDRFLERVRETVRKSRAKSALKTQ